MGILGTFKQFKNEFNEVNEERTCAICNKFMKKGIFTGDKWKYVPDAGQASKAIQPYIIDEDAFLCEDCTKALVILNLVCEDTNEFEEYMELFPERKQASMSYFMNNLPEHIKETIMFSYEKYEEKLDDFLKKEEDRKIEAERIEAERTCYDNGSGEKIDCLENKVVVTDFFGKATTLYYQDITAIEYKNSFKVFIEIKTGSDSTIIYFGGNPENAELAYKKILNKWEATKFNNLNKSEPVNTPSSPSITDEIIKLKKLLDEDIITNEEFVALKKKLING